jgi:hypothetical protein
MPSRAGEPFFLASRRRLRDYVERERHREPAPDEPLTSHELKVLKLIAEANTAGWIASTWRSAV